MQDENFPGAQPLDYVAGLRFARSARYSQVPNKRIPLAYQKISEKNPALYLDPPVYQIFTYLSPFSKEMYEKQTPRFLFH